METVHYQYGNLFLNSKNYTTTLIQLVNWYSISVYSFHEKKHPSLPAVFHFIHETLCLLARLLER